MICGTFARVGAYGIPADHLTMRITAPHGAFWRVLRSPAKAPEHRRHIRAVFHLNLAAKDGNIELPPGPLPFGIYTLGGPDMDKNLIEYFDIVKESYIDKDGNEIPGALNEGAIHAVHCFDNSLLDEADHFEVAELPKADQADDFLDIIKHSGVKEIAVTAEDGLLAFLQVAYSFGCKVVGVCNVIRHPYSNEPPTVMRGILVQF